MSRPRKPALPLPPPAPAPSPREAWDALLAALPLTDEQRRALADAADDLALDAAQEVAAEVSRRAHEVGNAAMHGCLAITSAANGVVTHHGRAALARRRAKP